MMTKKKFLAFGAIFWVLSLHSSAERIGIENDSTDVLSLDGSFSPLFQDQILMVPDNVVSSHIESLPEIFLEKPFKNTGSEKLNLEKNSAAIEVLENVNYWPRTFTVGARTFSGVELLRGVYDPSISANGNLVTVRHGGGEDKLINITYNNPSSPVATDVTPKKDHYNNDYNGVAFPMALAPYPVNNTYRSGMWGDRIKPGLVQLNKSGNAYNNLFSIDRGFQGSGHVYGIDKHGDVLSIMQYGYVGDDDTRRYHNIYANRFSGDIGGTGSFADQLISHKHGDQFTPTKASSQYPRLSGDGKYVVYESNSTELVATDSNFFRDIFVADTAVTQNSRFTRNTLVSQNSNGEQANGASQYADISEDGRFIVYATNATNLTSDNVGGIILHDRQLNSNRLISKGATGIPALSYGNPTISYDGRFVAFESTDSSLTDQNVSGNQLYVVDTYTDEIRLATPTLEELPAGMDSFTVSRSQISENGTHLVFLANRYVYRVESPFTREVLASVLPDGRQPSISMREIDSVAGGDDAKFNFPNRFINLSGEARNIAVQNEILYWTGTQWQSSGWLPHENLCAAQLLPCLVNQNGEALNIPYVTVGADNDDLNPFQLSVDYTLPPQWPVTTYISYYLFTDLTTGEETRIQMFMNKVSSQ
ncbi:TolB family protein [Marinibactrum halimedae]|uniref:Uncharacterized protein n=1 Tax=Marinibactrum halimedae TaxID=1444977 RepID=A0AA37T3M0_9GAMM|nr:hypothetical protein [Marinibactrum halimedae]MCD9460668.1 hypothetical protein [Marinibactrum halimedae]GLS24313.1 hypothetical protein GCM10007877_00240 [Marinibactrum halimedae]